MLHRKLLNLLKSESDNEYLPSWLTVQYVKPMYTIRMNHLCFNILIYTEKVNINSLKKKIITLLNKIYTDFKIEHFKNINIVLILSSYKKKIQKGEICDVDNINSGVCIHDQDPKAIHIVIYRLEDLMKVVIHELIHYIGLDITDNMKCTEINKLIKTSFKSLKNTDIFYNEALVEAVALIKYCQFTGRKLVNEKKYSIHQVKVFLHINQCSTVEQFRLKKYYTEKSHHFSYVFLKSMLIHNEKFESLVLNHNTFSSIDEKTLSSIVSSTLKDESWIKKVNNYKLMNKKTYSLRLTEP